jgi:integrase
MIDGVYFVPIRRTAKPTTWYVYAWRGGPRILKAAGDKKPTLGRAEVAAIATAHAERRGPDLSTLGGLLRELTIANGGAPEWQSLAASTRRVWSSYINRIEEKWGKTPLKLWDDRRMLGKVIAWRDSMAATPRAADLSTQVLGFVLEFARIRGRLESNVAAGVRSIYRPHGRAEIIWTADDIARFEASAIAMNRPRVADAIKLACLTGFRKADLVALTWDQVFEHSIARTAQKKSRGKRRRAVVPIVPELKRLLDKLRLLPRAPGVDNVLVSSLGRPWANLTTSVNAVRNHARIIEPADPELDLPERPKHLHDCRGTFVTHLCRQRLTDQEIADIVAWSPENVASIRRRYVDDAAIVVALGRRMAGEKL